MNRPEQPPAPPPPAHGVNPEKVGHAEHGIPLEANDAEPTGLPTSDRHHGETVPVKP